MRCAIAGLMVVALLHEPVSGQEIPVVGRPTSDFYNAQGNRVSARWELDRTSVPENEDLVATLVVSGATNPRDVLRPDLHKLPAFESRFVVTDSATAAPTADLTAIRITYRLRPRNRSVDSVPTLPFYYYNPAAAGRQFPMTTAKEVPITVTAPRPKSEAPAIPLAEPAWLVDYTPQPVSLSSPMIPGAWLWVAITLAGPAIGMGWFMLWRRIYPDGARLARIRRSRAARRAYDRIRHANRAPDPAAAIVAAVLGYLRARFPLSAEAATPTEIDSALTGVGLAAAQVDAVIDFLRLSDAHRFAQGGGISDAVAAKAAALINQLEAA